MSELAEQFAASLVDGGEAKFLVMHPEIEGYLSHSQTEASLYAILDSHLKKYGKLPSRGTVEEEWGHKLPKVAEPPAFYMDRLRPMHVRRMLQKASVEAQPLMLKDPEKSLSIMEHAVHKLRMEVQGLSMVDLRDSKDFLMKHLASKWQGGFYKMGWPSYDKVSGGLQAGDFIVFVGPTGLGKTMLLLSRAYHLWSTFGLRVLFVSMEMSLPTIIERAAALHASIPMDYLKQGIFPNIKTDFKKMLIDKLDASSKAKNPFWFVDANLAMGEDQLMRLCVQLNPDLVVVDGAYLGGRSGFHKRHEAIAEFATFLKQGIAMRLGIPVMASYQLTTDSVKEIKKGAKAIIENIAGSSEIGRLATTALGIFQGDDNPETLHKRLVDILKGRNGEIGRFHANWDFIKMDFHEVLDEPEQQMLEIT